MPKKGKTRTLQWAARKCFLARKRIPTIVIKGESAGTGCPEGLEKIRALVGGGLKKEEKDARAEGTGFGVGLSLLNG